MKTFRSALWLLLLAVSSFAHDLLSSLYFFAVEFVPRPKQALAVFCIWLTCLSAFGQTHTEVTAEDAQSITGLKTFTNTINQKPITDCRFFGTVGNGSMSGAVISGTDDTAAIQACINYAATNGTRAYLPSAGVNKCYRITHLIADNSAPSQTINGVLYAWPSYSYNTLEFFGDGQEAQNNLINRTFTRTTLCSTDTGTNSAFRVSALSTLPAGSYPYRAYKIHDFNLLQGGLTAATPIVQINQLTEAVSFYNLRLQNFVSGGNSGSCFIWSNLWSGSSLTNIECVSEVATPVAGTHGIWIYNNDPSGAGGGAIILDNTTTVAYDRGHQFGVVKVGTSIFGGADSVVGTPQLLVSVTAINVDSEVSNYEFVFGYGVQGLDMASWHCELGFVDCVVLTSSEVAASIRAGSSFEPNLTDAEIAIDANAGTGKIEGNYFQSVKTNAVHGYNLAATSGFAFRDNSFVANNGAATCFNVFSPNTSIEEHDICGGGFGTVSNDTTSWQSWAPWATGSNMIRNITGRLSWTEGTCTSGIASADALCAESTFHGMLYNPNNTGFVPLPKTVALTADWTCGTSGTVSSCVAATIIGSGGGVPLTFALPLVAASYKLECDLVVGQATAATANNWNLLTATNGATNVTTFYDMYTAAGVKASGVTSNQASTTTTFNIGGTWTLGGTATKMPVHIYARIEGGSASGTVASLQLVAPTVADLVTIYRGSSCTID